MRLVSVDPGANGIGAAAFDLATGYLHRAAYIRAPFEIRGWLSSWLQANDRLVIEFPRIYRAAQQKGDQNDLLHVARAVGRVEEVGDRIGARVELIIPRDWKGTLDGDAMVARIQGRIEERERGNVELPSAASLHHNVWDAVGIGLHALGRLAPRRVIAR